MVMSYDYIEPILVKIIDVPAGKWFKYRDRKYLKTATGSACLTDNWSIIHMSNDYLVEVV